MPRAEYRFSIARNAPGQVYLLTVSETVFQKCYSIPAVLVPDQKKFPPYQNDLPKTDMSAANKTG